MIVVSVVFEKKMTNNITSAYFLFVSSSLVKSIFFAFALGIGRTKLQHPDSNPFCHDFILSKALLR